MRAVVLRSGRLETDEVPEPVPQRGEVLVRTLACGICGSDLHAHRHTAEFALGMREQGGPRIDADRDMVMGHEFCAEVLDHGPGCSKTLPVGTHVCSMPVVLRSDGMQTVGYSHQLPGGFAERMVLSEGLLLPLPAGVDAELAALTEPLAVGLHAVEKGGLGRRDVALVLGCGPVGLAVLLALKARGHGPVVAADFSPARRAMAEALGADVVIDPGAQSPYLGLREAARTTDASEAAEPMAALFGRKLLRPTVIFECVGAPGVLAEVVAGAPSKARVVVVGVCMQADTWKPLIAIGKELELRFVLGYSPTEFASTLRFVADAGDRLRPMITGQVPLDGVSDAFAALASPEAHVKVMVRP